MVGNARNIVKPVPLRLCGQDLPWVETATHLCSCLFYPKIKKPGRSIQDENTLTNLSCL